MLENFLHTLCLLCRPLGTVSFWSSWWVNTQGWALSKNQSFYLQTWGENGRVQARQTNDIFTEWGINLLAENEALVATWVFLVGACVACLKGAFSRVGLLATVDPLYRAFKHIGVNAAIRLLFSRRSPWKNMEHVCGGVGERMLFRVFFLWSRAHLTFGFDGDCCVYAENI